MEESARHLSILFGEEVAESDVLRLGLDGHLPLSVDFVNHAKGDIGHVVAIKEAKMYVIAIAGDEISPIKARDVLRSKVAQLPAEIKSGLDDGSLKLTPMGDVINEQEVIQYTDRNSTLTGIWDLLMVGGERLDVEHEYQQRTSGLEVTLVNINGTFVKSNDGKVARILESFDNNEYQKGSHAQLERLKQHISEKKIDETEAESLLKGYERDRQEYLNSRHARPPEENYYPAGGLPVDSVLVVRTAALREFEDSLKINDTPLTQNERSSLLCIITALCDDLGLDVQSRGMAVQIAELTERIGAPVSDDTVRRMLKKIPDALEARMK